MLIYFLELKYLGSMSEGKIYLFLETGLILLINMILPSLIHFSANNITSFFFIAENNSIV